MSSSQTAIPSHEEIQFILAEYEFARDNRNHADATEWEMTAIVWGAQTLLLGFVLEAMSNRDVQPLIILVGTLGLVLCRFNYIVVRTRNMVCNLMNEICAGIENSTAFMSRKPQNRIDQHYPRKIQTFWFKAVNVFFAAAWLFVIVTAARLLCHPLR